MIGDLFEGRALSQTHGLRQPRSQTVGSHKHFGEGLRLDELLEETVHVPAALRVRCNEEGRPWFWKDR